MTASPPAKDQRAAALEYLRRLRGDLRLFCSSMLSVRTKVGTLEALVLNRAQIHLHEALQRQLADTGKVRALVLKGRQQGISTYVQARYYWRTTLTRGLRAYILTHRSDASANLFAIAQRFHQYHRGPKPDLGACNERELKFDGLESEYRVATAGAAGTGRSGTAQCFHGSEVGFWPEADEHMAGIGQVIADLPGTEIILESTANGVGNFFHRAWLSAERGESDYLPVFIPWFWQPEYSRPVVGNEEWTRDEQEYASAFGLRPEQLKWRRAKIADDFGGDEARFRQEYPASASEAFVAVGHESFIPAALVLGARGRRLEAQTQQLVVGVDPARYGKDSTAIARRRGRQCLPIERLRKRDLMHQAGRIAILIREEKPLRVFIDIGGLGAGLYDRLVELGYGDTVTAISFGSEANQPDRYLNRRAEMWGNLRDWLGGGSMIPADDDVLAGDLVGPTFTYDSQGRLKLESKEDMRKRGVPSPDSADALGLTFAMPLATLSDQTPGGRAWEDMIEAFQGAVEHADRGLEGIQTG
jgi:hypothetical protein